MTVNLLIVGIIAVILIKLLIISYKNIRMNKERHLIRRHNVVKMQVMRDIIAYNSEPSSYDGCDKIHIAMIIFNKHVSELPGKDLYKKSYGKDLQEFILCNLA